MGSVSFFASRIPHRCLKREKLLAWKQRCMQRQQRNSRLSDAIPLENTLDTEVKDSHGIAFSSED